MSALRLWVHDPSDEDPRQDRTQSASTTGSERRIVQTGGDVIREYLADLKYRRDTGQVKPSHYENYRRSLEAAPRYADGKSRYVGFIEIVGDLPIGDLINYDMTRWLRANPRWASPETRRNNTAAAIACFNWAKGMGFLRQAPYERIGNLKEDRVSRRDATDAELVAVWSKATPALRRVLLLIDRLGMRTCEARMLEFDKHIRWEQAVIWFEPDEHKNGRKTGKPLIIGVMDDVLEQLRRWNDERRPGRKLVCLSERGRPWTQKNLDERFCVAREKAGLPDDLTPYCFRHRCITQGQLAGAPIEAMQMQVGHGTAATTKRYTHLDDKPEYMHARAAAAKANADSIATFRARRRKADHDTPLFDGLD